MYDGKVLLIFKLKKFRIIFFACIFTTYLKLKKNNDTEVSFLKHNSRNEMLIHCFACKDFIRSFFIILGLYQKYILMNQKKS